MHDTGMDLHESSTVEKINSMAERFCASKRINKISLKENPQMDHDALHKGAGSWWVTKQTVGLHHLNSQQYAYSYQEHRERSAFKISFKRRKEAINPQRDTTKLNSNTHQVFSKRPKCFLCL